MTYSQFQSGNPPTTPVSVSTSRGGASGLDSYIKLLEHYNHEATEHYMESITPGIKDRKFHEDQCEKFNQLFRITTEKMLQEKPWKK